MNWTAILVLSGGAYLFKVVGFVAGDLHRLDDLAAHRCAKLFCELRQ